MNFHKSINDIIVLSLIDQVNIGFIIARCAKRNLTYRNYI